MKVRQQPMGNPGWHHVLARAFKDMFPRYKSICCYWPRANNWGAFAAIATGAVLPLGFLILQQVPATHDYATRVGPYYSGIAAYLGAATAMVVGSLLKNVLRGNPVEVRP